MGTKIIIICGILVVATILLGLFRLWWLRKCYDKARAEKKNVLEREQQALAYSKFKTYDEVKSATLKYMVIAPVVIAILGCAVLGFNRIVVAQKAEKEQAKVGKNEEDSNKGFFYYFSYDANLERFIEARKEKLEKAQAEYQEVAQNLTKAKQSGDLAQITKCNIKLKDLKEDLVSAQDDYNNLEDFSCNFAVHRFGYGVLIFFLILFVFGLFACCTDEDKFKDLAFAAFGSRLFSVVSVAALIFGFFMSWWSLIAAVLVLFNVFVLVLKRKAIAEAYKKAEEKAKNKDNDGW